MEHRFWIATAYKDGFTKDEVNKLFSILPENVEVVGVEEGLDFFYTRTVGEDEVDAIKIPQDERAYTDLKYKIRSLEDTLNAKSKGLTYSESLNERIEQELEILYSQLINWPRKDGMVINYRKAELKDGEIREVYQQKVNEAGFGDY